MSDDVTPVIRPSVPPLAWLTVGVWAGVLISETVAWKVFGGRLSAWCVPLCPVVALGGAAVALRRRWAVVTLVLAGIVAGSVAGGACWNSWRHDVRVARRAGARWTLVTAGDAAAGRFGESVTGEVVNPAGTRLKVVARFGSDLRAPELRHPTRVSGRVKAASPDERGRMMHQDGVVGTLSVSRAESTLSTGGVTVAIGGVRAWCGRRVRSVPEPAGALLSGVLLGDRRRLAGTPAEADFRTTGLTHLVAVSGSHLVVVAALVAWGLERLRAHRTLRVTAVLLVMAGYVVATGVQASAVRALVMAAVSSGAVSAGRRTDRAASLAAAATVGLVAWPPVAFDLGFALSVASVAGLLLFARLAAEWFAAGFPCRLSVIAEPLALTVVAQVATLPIATPVFGVISLVAPLANLLVGPVVAVMLIVGLGGLATCLVSAAAGGVVLNVAGAMASLAMWVAGHLAALPAASVPVQGWGILASVGVVVACALVWAAWPHPRREHARLVMVAAALLTVVVAAGPRAPDGARVVVLDVGQGDAILIQDGVDTALVDTGPDPGVLRAALARQGTRGLRWVAFTHAHDDHTGGTRALQGAHKVEAVVIPMTQEPAALSRLADDLEAPLVPVRAGQILMVGSIRVTVIWPREAVSDSGENDASLVLLAERGDRRVLLTGDAESCVLDPLARDGDLPDIDTLKVGHHGSRVSLSGSALDTLRPEEAVVSVGAGNRFGHPTPEALQILSHAGCVVRRTDRDGDVVIALE